MYNRPHSIVL